jgi:hypothetical protein
MRSLKPGTIDIAAGAELRVIVSTALLTLLLIGQFPPLEDNTASRPVFDSGGDLSGAEQAKPGIPDLLSANIPDESVFRLPKYFLYSSVSPSKTLEVEARASFSNIRAPPVRFPTSS